MYMGLSPLRNSDRSITPDAVPVVPVDNFTLPVMSVQVGEPMGDRGQFWGEGDRAVLPHSKIPVRYATAYHDWENGCALEQITTCFLLNYVYGAAPGPLTPQLTASPRFAYYASGRDMVMDEVMKVIRSAAVASVAQGKGAAVPSNQPN